MLIVMIDHLFPYRAFASKGSSMPTKAFEVPPGYKQARERECHCR